MGTVLFQPCDADPKWSALPLTIRRQGLAGVAEIVGDADRHGYGPHSPRRPTTTRRKPLTRSEGGKILGQRAARLWPFPNGETGNPTGCVRSSGVLLIPGRPPLR